MKKILLRIVLTLCMLLTMLSTVTLAEDNEVQLVVPTPLEQVTNVALSASGVATWNNVTNASGYEVQLYKDGSPQGIAVAKGASELSHDFLPDMRAAGAGIYTVKVKAKGNGTTYSDGPQSVASGSQTITKLGTVTGLTWAGDVAKWTPIPNVAYYEVQLYRDGIKLYDPLTILQASAVTGANFSSYITVMGAGTYTYKVTAKADSSSLFLDADQSETSSVNDKAASNDADLSGLSISSGAFNVGFTSERTVYHASVRYEVSSITVTPTVKESHATVKVQGRTVTSGQPSTNVDLNIGFNIIRVEVTAEDGTTTKEYLILVTREERPSYIPPYIPPQPTTETRETPVVVGNGKEQISVVKTTITRTTDIDGLKKDTVVLDEITATEAVKKASETKSNSITISISIPDTLRNNADKTEIRLPGGSLAKLASNNLNLSLQTETVSLDIPVETACKLGTNDTSIQISEEKSSNKIAENKEMISKIAPGSKIITSPLNIEANIIGRVKLTIPIDKSKLPSSKEELDKFLSSLAVAIHHSDGQNEVDKGTLVYDKNKNATGIVIWVDKFSSFTLINLPTTYFQGKTTIMQDKVAANKEWQVKFSKPLDSATLVKDNVYVVDSSGNIMESKLTYTSDNILKVAPVNSYKSGETYYLYITKGVEAKDKTSLVNGLRYQFTVE